MEDGFEFTFGWYVLKELGRELYSNPFSAISELVANGFDADANTVYVYIECIDKLDSRIEIIDNGCGMGLDELKNYVFVGRNRRLEDLDDKKKTVMGRKGIGKLAALYLSDHYILVTKTNHENQTSWRMNYNENEANMDEKPSMIPCSDNIDMINENIWNELPSGTAIIMKNVNLSGLGDAAFSSLENRLANYFSFSDSNRSIMFSLIKNKSDKNEFKNIEKQIAFKNMAFIDYSVDNDLIFDGLKDNKVAIPSIKNNEVYHYNTDISKFSTIESISSNSKHPYKGFYDFKGKKYPYELKGWIGAHSTIDVKNAKNNDELFEKNKFYNPIQIRLYVRNKLAIENCIPILNNTQAMQNYIEGEVHFDILDDSSLPDIANTNRQDINQSDERFQLFIKILENLVSDLIKKRKELKNNIIEKSENDRISKINKAKTAFTTEIKNELSKYKKIDENETNEIVHSISSLVEGDVTPKSDYLIFISHRGKQHYFADFFYNYLKSIGVTDEELYYTSDCDDESIVPLSDQIRRNIIHNKTLLFYVITSDYLKSEYCLFEGGAGWATRSIGDYYIISLKNEYIPKFLTNGKREKNMYHDGSLKLDEINYRDLVNTLNKLIDYINEGRSISGRELIKNIEKTEIPNKVVARRQGKTIDEYMDKDILDYWNVYVVENTDKLIDSN